MNPSSKSLDSTERDVLFVVRNFPPVRNSGTIRVESFVRHLSKHGYRSTVLCNTTPPELAPSPDGVLPPEQRIELSWREPQGLIRRNLFRFPLGYGISRQVNRNSLADRAIRLCHQRNYRPEIVLGSCPPGEALFVGQAIAEHYRCPFVADYRDPWTYISRPNYPHWIDFLLERRVEQQLLRKTTAVLSTTEAGRSLLEREFQVPSKKIQLLRNGYENSEFENPECFEPIAQEPNHFHIVYTGEIASSQPASRASQLIQALGFSYDPLQTHWQARSPQWFLQGLSDFLKNSPQYASEIRVWFIGDQKVSQDPVVRGFPHPECIRVFPRVPQKMAVGATLQANLLLFLQLETFYRGSPLCMFIAGKLYSYLATGKRILAGVQKSENTDLIDRFQAGTWVSPTSASEFATAIAAEFQRWKSGTAPPDQPRRIPEFERSYQAGQLAQLFDSLIGARTPHESPVVS